MAFSLRRALVWLSAILLSAGSSVGAWSGDGDARQEEMHTGLRALSAWHFEGPRGSAPWVPAPDAHSGTGAACLVIVGFTGGIERGSSRTSGVATLNALIRERVAADARVLTLTFNNFRWRRAATEVIRAAQASQGGSAAACGLPQPLIIAHGHSWGANSITKFAREIRKAGLEVSLAIYIDTFALRNPRVPDNVRYAVNVYQRAGILRGLPFRGKRKLVVEDPAATHMLGSFALKPESDKSVWSRNLLLPLLCKQHHLLPHDWRLRAYLLDIVAFKLALLSGTPADRERVGQD